MISRTRTISFIGLAVVVGVLLVSSFWSPGVVTKEASGSVSLTVDFGDLSVGGVREWKDIPLVTGATAFSILKQEVERAQMPLMYDPSTGAGIFVRQIGDKKNGDGGRYWQYWVHPVRSRPADPDRNSVSDGVKGTATTASGRSASNGVNEKFALVAADQYPLSSGDAVKWKFVEENSKF